jgi:hypothetical protein
MAHELVPSVVRVCGPQFQNSRRSASRQCRVDDKAGWVVIDSRGGRAKTKPGVAAISRVIADGETATRV